MSLYERAQPIPAKIQAAPGLSVEFRRFHFGRDHSIVILINNRRSRAYSVIYTLYRSDNRITAVPTSAFKQRLMSEFLFCGLIKSREAFGQ